VRWLGRGACGFSQWSTIAILLLEACATTIFGDAPQRIPPVPGVDASALVSHASDPILKKRVVGKEDVDIAALIRKLEASDWVADGMAYFEKSEGKCPFCQQDAPPSLADDLAAYFDESFKADNDTISELVSGYDTDARTLEAQMDAIEASDCPILNKETAKAYLGALKACVEENRLKLATKKKEPSRAVTLEPLDSHVQAITDLITAANVKIAAHNKTVDNLASEQRELTNQVWRYLLDVEIKTEIEKYDKARDGLQKAVQSLEKQITEQNELISATKLSLRDLERKTTSIQPTISGINQLLAQFGFRQFLLRDSGDGRSYQLVRADGSDAKKTLSEGEKGFVTFLYFYHLLKGSNTESGMTTDRVVVFDDPVSSLDSDVLFIVSSLIKGLCDEVRTQPEAQPVPNVCRAVLFMGSSSPVSQ